MSLQEEYPSKCPKCLSESVVKSGLINNKQRFKCKDCNYFFTVGKLGKSVDNYYVIKALQLYLEGISYREIERILGISHVTVMNIVKRHLGEKPVVNKYKPSYKIMRYQELVDFFVNKESLKGQGLVVTELGDKYMVITWDRFKR
ncbi:insertion element protein [Pseudopedobacter saltans DSM 12145]|uniref:Insertion element protein n=1 Tax=Pseudopedobacter saltans (strain ATCC 51119 / DSM 12145 / JCM 21818 / CCUG 39354 / LMG 10337 / NBRC 100064 / NCIMB 13643) TaxID=762903 RepID=F0SEI8_PSESL|nr:helix-turn-helix domain-containing protein [Pseudopedobacter saltans]ADY50853.1 insertion element protein [Pseudopedobacter saltans DSM 12145]